MIRRLIRVSLWKRIAVGQPAKRCQRTGPIAVPGRYESPDELSWPGHDGAEKCFRTTGNRCKSLRQNMIIMII